MTRPLSTMPTIAGGSSGGGGASAAALQKLLTSTAPAAPMPQAQMQTSPNFSTGLFQQRGSQLRAQGQAAGEQAGKALTDQFAGRGFSTDSAALGQQRMLAALMGNAQGVGAANKDLLSMGGEDQSFAAIQRQMEQDRARAQMTQNQAAINSRMQLMSALG